MGFFEKLNSLAKLEEKTNSLFSSAFDSLDKAFEELNNDDLIIRGKDLFSNFGDVFKDVKDSLKDLEVTVPYDKTKDKLSWKVEDGTITVKVEANDGTRHNEVTATVDENCMVDKMTRSVNEKDGTITFIIPKKKSVRSIKNEKIQNLLKEYDEQKEKLLKKLNADIKAVNEEQEAVEPTDEQIDNGSNVPTAEPMANDGCAATSKKPMRDKKGRFVSAKAKDGSVKIQ